MSHLAALPSAMPAATCVPTNDLLSKPLKYVLDQMAGGIGGVLLPIAGVILVVLVIWSIVTIMSDKASKAFKSIARLVAVICGLPLIILLVSAVYTMLNNACGVNIFG